MKLMPYAYLVRATLMAWLCVLGLLLIVCLFVMNTSLEARQQWRESQQRLAQRQQQALHLTNAHHELQLYRDHGLRWQQRGLMLPVEADRLEQALIALQQVQTLPHLTYEIQQPVICPASRCQSHWPRDPPPNIPFTITPIQLHWTVMHESAAMAWLQSLAQHYEGMLLVRHCDWKPKPTSRLIDVHCALEVFNFPHALPPDFRLATTQDSS